MVAINRGDRLVRSDDLKRVLQCAQQVKVPSERKLLHVIPRGYAIDGQTGVDNPVGMHGFRLDVEAHIITAATTSIQNLIKCIRRIGIDIDDLILEPLASSEAVLTEDEKQVGVILADIGGGTTDVAVFKDGGTVTAGNSSQMSDGSAGVIIMSRAKAEELGLKPMVRFISFAAAGVPPEIMGMGPVAAVPKALKYAGLQKEDMGVIELNEAFAAQSVAVLRELDLNTEIVNVNGGAIALGHPLGCTGAKLTTQLLYEMENRGTEFGMVTMCIGGGMGAAGIFQKL